MRWGRVRTPRTCCSAAEISSVFSVESGKQSIRAGFRLYFGCNPVKTDTVSRLVRFVLYLLLLEPIVVPAQAGFSSLYVFGDGVCTTTNNDTPFPYITNYYGLRRCNGRVWVEVLAQRQGLTYESNKNWSFYGHSSSNLVMNVNNFSAPTDASNSLFVVWVNDADFVDYMVSIYQSFGTNIVRWTNAINQSLSNHFKAITNLYHAKGARTLVMPNAVDIMKVPQYSQVQSGPVKSFVRARIIDFNASFSTTLMNQIKTNCPDITIYVPNLFALLDDMVTNSAYYGLTNVLYLGNTTDVVEDALLPNKALNGPGTNYIFWDATDPTAKAHGVIADLVQQIVSPVQVSKITSLSGSNRLDVANVPIGLNGFVDGTTNFVDWAGQTNVISTNATQSVFVPASDPMQFYRLRFPFAWSWP